MHPYSLLTLAILDNNWHQIKDRARDREGERNKEKGLHEGGKGI